MRLEPLIIFLGVTCLRSYAFQNTEVDQDILDNLSGFTGSEL